MYYPDLSQYNYIEDEDNTLNIGWLDVNHPFLKGALSDTFTERLILFRQYIVRDENLGPHKCHFCGKYRSSGELRVFGRNNTIYAAPTMIIHYVVEHNYFPPQEFIDAVLHGPHPPSQEYTLRAKQYVWAQEED